MGCVSSEGAKKPFGALFNGLGRQAAASACTRTNELGMH
jgi:hypothetical protein